jgi:light-independent protochlorophyllide reductase subunit B
VSPAADPVHEGSAVAAAAAVASSVASSSGVAVAEAPAAVAVASGEPEWTSDGEAELHKIPFFVRGKVRRNTEAFARERGLSRITAETLYDAKAHFSR